MKDKLASFIMSIIIILIICVFGIFGIIFWQELKSMQTSFQPENLQTIITAEDNEEKIEKDIIVSDTLVNPLDNLQDKPNLKNDKTEDVNNNDASSENRYFYNQLEETSKTIYKAFETNYENMKTGTFKINLGNSFYNILEESNGQEKLGKYYQSAIEAYTYDNPGIFYLSPNKMYLNIETTTRNGKNTYNVFINNGKEANYFIDDFSSKEQVEQAIASVEQVKNELVQKRSGNVYEDIKMVHDYLVENIVYDTSISKENIYNIYGALVNRECVCEGYARAFKYILNDMDIPCILVIGKATNSEGKTENHAWNYVQLDGKWYAVDVTWDDPIIVGGGFASKSSKYKYFLKGSNEFLQDHSPNGQFTDGGKVFNYPDLSNTNWK